MLDGILNFLSNAKKYIVGFIKAGPFDSLDDFYEKEIFELSDKIKEYTDGGIVHQRTSLSKYSVTELLDELIKRTEDGK